MIALWWFEFCPFGLRIEKLNLFMAPHHVMANSNMPFDYAP